MTPRIISATQKFLTRMEQKPGYSKQVTADDLPVIAYLKLLVDKELNKQLEIQYRNTHRAPEKLRAVIDGQFHEYERVDK